MEAFLRGRTASLHQTRRLFKQLGGLNAEVKYLYCDKVGQLGQGKFASKFYREQNYRKNVGP